MPFRASRLPLLVVLILPISFLRAEDPSVPAENDRSPAYRAWQVGQLAMEKEDFDRAIGQFQLSLRLDPQFSPSRLSLAAAYLALGEDRQALPQLEHYIRARPEHLSVRAHYAELLLRLDRPADARGHFERCVADAQQAQKEDQHLVHCHTRLMEIAERLGDDYSAHLNRGIGLYHLARQRSSLEDDSAGEVAESLLCKAAAELTLARLQQPDAVRPCWYLHEVWSRLAQRQPAQRWLRSADSCVTVADLTPVERRNLRLACEKDEDERRSRK
jgi:tetratricopeptide (TPR) repeat protein